MFGVWVEAYAQDLVDGGILRWGRREGAEDRSERRLRRGSDGGRGNRGPREGLPEGLPYRRGDELSEERAGHDCANLPKFRWVSLSSDQGDDRAKKLEPSQPPARDGRVKPRLRECAGWLILAPPQVLVTSATRTLGERWISSAQRTPSPRRQRRRQQLWWGLSKPFPPLLFFFKIVVG